MRGGMSLSQGLHATKLDEMQLLLMLIHAGFEKELPAGRETLTCVFFSLVVVIVKASFPYSVKACHLEG